MVKKVLASANRKTSTGAAAFLISGSYLLSQLLGLVRDRLLASHFGIVQLSDAYTAAFRLPDLLFTLLVSGALAVAFIPIFTKHWVKDEHEQAWELTNDILNFLIIGTIVLALVCIVLADPLTHLITPGFDPERHALTVHLTRIMLATPLLFSVSSVLGSVQQAFQRFLVFALSGVLYNVGIIVGIIFLAPSLSIYGVAYGVVIGAGLQAAVQLLGLVGLGYRYHFTLNWRNKNLHQVLKLMVPRSIDQGIDQINYIVETIIGSGLATGSLSAYYFANNLKNVPLVIFGTAISTAAFPGLAAAAARGKTDQIIEQLAANARLILFFVIPSSAIIFIMRGYIIRLLFGFGNPTTASLLGWFIGVIIFQSLFFIVSRVYYALEDTRTPLYVSLFAITLNIFLSFWWSRRFGVAGLAMAQSLVAMLESIVLWVILRQRLGHIGGGTILSGLVKILTATGIMSLAVYLLVRILPLYRTDRGLLIVGPKFLAIAAAGLVAYLIPCYILQLKEAKAFVSRLSDYINRSMNWF